MSPQCAPCPLCTVHCKSPNTVPLQGLIMFAMLGSIVRTLYSKELFNYKSIFKVHGIMHENLGCV
jgi:hypothetical protein